ncbi:MAG: hypothetical protein WBM09_02435 [Gallionella sp.]
MKIVPSLPPVVTAEKVELGVDALSPVKPVKPVQPGTPPYQAEQPRAHPNASPDNAAHEERRHDVEMHGERRIYCRRIEQRPMLVELRSGFDRRRHNQREDDIKEHVDEQV